MKLSIIERISLLEALPKEGDFVTLKLVRKLRESLSFSEDEIRDADFSKNWKCTKCNKEQYSSTTPQCECGSYMTETGQVKWDGIKGESVIKDIHMGDAMMNMCTTALKKLNNDGKLTEFYMSVYEKMVGEKDG